MLNLAINARDAMQVGGTLRVATANANLGPPQSAEAPPAGEYVIVSVSDTGTGMTDEVRAKVFEPFFTTKEVGKGSGLGLSQVLGFAKQSGGGVEIESALGRGTTVHIYLPRAEAAAVRAGSSAGRFAVEEALSNLTILLVDDDNAVREVTRAMLEQLGYKVVEAGSGGAALDLVEQGRRIDLLIADFAMPGMNGAELARLARLRRPALPVLFVTGFADRTALDGIGESQIIRKPFVELELAGKIRMALAERASSNVVRLRG